jgi:hypothetical protein
VIFRSCASSLDHTCFLDYGNLHNGEASFDNFFGAFLLMFQVKLVFYKPASVPYILHIACPVSTIYAVHCMSCSVHFPPSHT